MYIYEPRSQNSAPVKTTSQNTLLLFSSREIPSIRSVFNAGPSPIRSYICIAQYVYQPVFQELLKLMTYISSKILILKYHSKAIMWKNGSMEGASKEITAMVQFDIQKSVNYSYVIIAIYQKTHKRKAIWIYYSLIVFITIELTEFRSRFDSLSTSRN
jgi:hypothetical protein